MYKDMSDAMIEQYTCDSVHDIQYRQAESQPQLNFNWRFITQNIAYIFGRKK